MIHWLVLLLALPLAYANSTSSNTWLSCGEFTLPNGGVTQEICAELQVVTTNITMDDGSESIAYQVYTYNILDVPNGIDVFEVSNYSEYLSGTIVNVTQSFIEGSCDVTINGTACTNCEICGTAQVSVDCSVIPGGRAVGCESVEYVYLPFEEYPLPHTATDAGIVNTTTNTTGTTGDVAANTTNTTGDVAANTTGTTNTTGDVPANTTGTTDDVPATTPGTTDDVLGNSTTPEGDDGTNSSSQVDNNTPEESSSYRSMAAVTAVMVAAVATFLQL